MKTFKTLSILLLIAMLASCSQSKPGHPSDDVQADSDKPVFYLSELPQLAPFEIPPEIKRRYSEEAYVDKLKLAGDYNKLYPYLGKWKEPSDVYTGSGLYGLVDSKGRIVVDPVYRSANYLDTDSEYLCLIYPVGFGGEQVENPYSAELGPKKIVIASSRGDWVIDGLIGYSASYSEERIIVICSEETDEEDRQVFKVYDTNGKFIFEREGYLDGFSEGLGAETVYEQGYAGWSNKTWMQYIDRNGNVVIPGPFLSAEEFKNGEARVSIGVDNDNARFAVINTKGEFVKPPTMDWDTQKAYTSKIYDYYVSERNGYQGINDSTGKTILPAEYDWVTIDEEDSLAVAGRHYGDDYDHRCYFVSLPGGEKKEFDGKATSAYFLGGGWCAVEYAWGKDDEKVMTLVKGEAEYKFDYTECASLHCEQIKDDVFAMVYRGLTEGHTLHDNNGRIDIFDAGLGKTTKSFPGFNDYYALDDGFYKLPRLGSDQFMVFNDDFDPLFPEGFFTPCGSWLTKFIRLGDGVYQVRTVFYSGLIKEDGEWLVRVNISYTD